MEKNRLLVKINIFLVCVVVLMCFTLLIGNFLKNKYTPPEVDHWEEYTVKSGDTYWDIVEVPEGYNVQATIDMVREHNGNKELYFHDKIEIPVWSYEK